MENIQSSIIFILKGSIVTVKLFVVIFLFSIPLGVILAFMKVSKNKFLKNLVGLYTWVFRGTPLLLQLFFVYFGLPALGFKLSRFNAASIAFVLNFTAYFTEIFRAGIESIDKGQYEAAKALGMNYGQMMRRIIMPQTIRRVIPATSNEAISLVKSTSIVATIGMEELLRSAKLILSRDFTITPFFIAAAVYLILTSVLVIIFDNMEKKYSIFE